MLIGGLVPHIQVHGGVRRYFEMGNALVRLGHQYHLYYQHLFSEKEPWMDFHGRLLPYDEILNFKHDLVFTGAAECLNDLEKINTDVQLVLVVANFYTDYYRKIWEKFGKNFLWIGVYTGWQDQFGENGPEGPTIPGGINLEFFKPRQLKSSAKYQVVFYGRHPQKRGIDFILDCISRIKLTPLMKDLDFIAYDRELISAEQIQAGVKFYSVKQQLDLLELLDKSHIIISAMPAAGWNNVIIEGMAMKMVPLTTIAGVKDFLMPKINGWIFELGNHNSFIEGLKFVTQSRERFLEMSTRAYTSAQSFSWQRYTENLLEAVKSWQLKKK